MPIAGPKISGTSVVAPNSVSTCCAPASSKIGREGTSSTPYTKFF